jgi:MFS family permease
MTVPAQRPASPPASAPSRLPGAVVALGWVSLLTDAASDMIYPLVPAFLLSIGGGATALGWLEGVAEAVSAAFKLVSGRASDRSGRRKPLIALGYGISTAARPLLAVVTHPAQAVVVRALDRVGKGLRGPPRDAMVAGATPAAQRGHAFGFHRMMDNLGGAIGPLCAFGLLRLFDLPLRQVFAASLVPGLLAVLVVLAFVKEPPAIADQARRDEDPAPPSAERAWLGPLRRYYGALLLFSLAGAGDLFLLHRLTELGLDLAFVPVAWVSLQLGKGLLNVPGGHAADRYGKKRVLSIAWALYAFTYAGFGLASSWVAAWILLGLYAVHYGLAEAAQRTLLAEYAPDRRRGRAYGVQLALEGGMGLAANVGFGHAIERFGSAAAFVGAGVIAAAAAVALGWLVPEPAEAKG